MAVEWKKVVVESSSANISQNAATATALATARNLQVTLTETDAASFDGTGNVTDIGVTGTLAVTNGGTGLASFPKGSLLQADAANSLAALSGDPSSDNGKVVAYNATNDLFELIDSGTATNATNVTVTDNESTNEDNLITFVADAATSTGNHGLEMDGNLTYNPSTGTLTSTNLVASTQVTSAAFVGNLTGNVTGTIQTAAQGNITSLGTLTALTVDDITIDGSTISDAGNFDIDSGGNVTIDADGGTITFSDGGVSLGTITSAGYSGTAAVATTVTITDNESTNENNPIVFVAGADADGGNLGLETDGNAHYNPSTGTITATAFAGNLTGNVTGSADTVATSASSSSDAHFIAMFANASGDQAPVTDAGLKYTPSSDTLTVSNLTVSGTTTTVNTTDLEVTDKIIRVANNGTDAATVALAGMEIDTEDTTQLPFIGFKDGAALTEMIVRKEGATTDFPIAVMAHDAGAPGSSSDAAGKGAFYYDTTNNELYLQVNT